jgi:hypothetical protein
MSDQRPVLTGTIDAVRHRTVGRGWVSRRGHGEEVAVVSDQRGRVGVVEPAAGAEVGRRCLRWAWISVALLPLGFVGGMLLGEALVSAQGFEVGSDELPPPGVALLAGLPAW